MCVKVNFRALHFPLTFLGALHSPVSFLTHQMNMPCTMFPSAVEKYVMDAERVVMQAIQNNRKISCLFTECVVVNCGVIVPPRNYFSLLYK